VPWQWRTSRLRDKVLEQDLDSVFGPEGRRWTEDYPDKLLDALRFIRFNATEFALPYSVLAY
jgi:hypothetical protein